MIGQALAAWSQPSVNDEGAWRSFGDGGSYPSAAGSVTERSAHRIGAVFGAVNILADGLAQLPAILYDRLDEDRRRKSTDPLARTLHDQPNADQSAFEFVHQMQAWASVRPFAYAEMVNDGGLQLIPRHPDRILVERMTNGKRRYQYLEDDGHTRRVILAEDMFRVPGKPVLEYAAESIGLAQAVQRYSSRTFARGVNPRGLISHEPNTVWTDTQKKAFKDALLSEHGGPDKAGGVLMLPEGLKWTQLGMTNEQAQLVATSTGNVADIARYFSIAPYRLGVTEPGTMSYASVEMQSLEFVVYTLMPWVRRWEQAFGKDVLLRSDQYVEFLTAILLKGTTADRFAAYATAIQWGWLSVNEVRRLENLDRVEGGDVYLRPLNMTPSADSPAGRMLRLLVEDTAGSVVRKETLAMLRAASQHADDPAAWQDAVSAFYDSHGPFVAKKLHMPLGEGLAYAREQRLELLSEGPSVIERWQQEGDPVDDLTTRALEAA